jgi:oligopeptidase B
MKHHTSRRRLIITTALWPILAGLGISATPNRALSKPAPSKWLHSMSLIAPKPKKIPHKIKQLGRTRIDDYAWMKDDRWAEVLRDPSLIKSEVKDALILENAYTEAVLAPTKDLQAQIFAEMKGRIKEDDASLPVADGEFDYYSRYETGAQHPITARRPRSVTAFAEPLPSFNETKAFEQILLDENQRAADHDYYDTGSSSHSNDHKLFAWSEDTQGSECQGYRNRRAFGQSY